MSQLLGWLCNKLFLLGILLAVFGYTLFFLHQVGHAYLPQTGGRVMRDHRILKEVPNDTVYTSRRNQMLTACDGKVKRYRGKTDVSELLTVDHRHRLIYCPIAKVASTFWKRVMQVSSGVKEEDNPFDVVWAHDNSLETLKRYDFDLGFWTLKNYTSVMFVREPYSRLLASYIDKFFTTDPEFWSIGKIILKNHRPKASELALSCGHDVTFPEFIKHVIRDIQTAKPNGHWKPMYQVCGPCQVQYDFIGKLETSASDMGYILNNYLKGDVKLTDVQTESEINTLTINTNGLWGRYTDEAAKCMPFAKHILRFIRKQQIRGFVNKAVEIPASLLQRQDVKKSDLEQFVVTAYKTIDDRTLKGRQRMEALAEAYSSVPVEDMLELQRLYKPDFEIFGYDPRPLFLYSDEARRNITKFYFDV